MHLRSVSRKAEFATSQHMLSRVWRAYVAMKTGPVELGRLTRVKPSRRLQVRSKAAALLRKFPLADCSPDVQRAVLSGGPGGRGLPRVPGLRQTQSLRVPLERGPRDSPANREPGARPLRPSRFHGPNDGATGNSAYKGFYA